MNISKLHLRIDDLGESITRNCELDFDIFSFSEDEIIREKMKINVVCGQLDETFQEMLHKYWFH